MVSIQYNTAGTRDQANVLLCVEDAMGLQGTGTAASCVVMPPVVWSQPLGFVCCSVHSTCAELPLRSVEED